MGSESIMEKWGRHRDKKKKQRENEAELVQWIERLAGGSESPIRKVEGYREKLRKPVENAIGHIQGVIDSIPGPFGLSPTSWDKDALAHALFVSPEEIRSLLKKCADLKSFFQESGAKNAVALLTAAKKERTVFVKAMEGEILRGDVPETAVEFYDHRVVAPSETEEGNRKELLYRGLYVLTSDALEEFERIQAVSEELSEQRQLLDLTLKMGKSRERRPEKFFAGDSVSDAETVKAGQLMAEIDQQLAELGQGAGTPRDFLKKLEAVLMEPDKFLTVKTLSMNLDWMGIKREGPATETGYSIDLAELEIPDRMKRVAVLVGVSAEECLG